MRGGVSSRANHAASVPPGQGNTWAYRHGLGSRWRAGVIRAIGVRLRAPVEGSEVTTSGSSRLFSAWSIAANKARDPRNSMGAEKTRIASLLHTAHPIDSGAVPSGRETSNTPSWSHRYSYVATALLFLSQQRHVPTQPQPRPRESANTSADLQIADTPPGWSIHPQSNGDGSLHIVAMPRWTPFGCRGSCFRFAAAFRLPSFPLLARHRWPAEVGVEEPGCDRYLPRGWRVNSPPGGGDLATVTTVLPSRGQSVVRLA